MMKSMTRFERNIPVATSSRASASSCAVAPRRWATVRRPRAFSSSTSCDACQKKRYGEIVVRSEEHTSELQSRSDLVCRLLLEKKKKISFKLDTSSVRANYNVL